MFYQCRIDWHLSETFINWVGKFNPVFGCYDESYESWPERLVRSGRGFPEGIIEAWANLYTEFAVAISAHKDGIDLPYDYISCPLVEDGAEGVRFIEAAASSHQQGSVWVSVG